MDFLYRNIHMESKKWEAATQMTIEEDINIPELKGDCVALLLKEATIIVDETRVGREQVVVKGSLRYQILYETAGGCRLEQISGEIPFEESIHATGTTAGEMAYAKGVVEDFKVSMINTRKVALQSVVMLMTGMSKLLEEEWTEDVVNAEPGMEKLCEAREVLQLCQKKSDVFRVKEELELPGGYPAIQSLLWKQITLGELEARPMDGRVSLKGELDCFFIYLPQGAVQGAKMLQKKVAFHGLIDCSGCENDMNVSVLPSLQPCTVEVKPDMDGEDRVLYLEAALDLQIRVYGEEKIELLRDIYSTAGEVELTEKTVQAPVLHIAGEGKYRLKQNGRLKEGTPRASRVLHTCSTVYPDRTVWERGKLCLAGGVQVQVLYATGEEEMPYAVTEYMVPYTLEMESMANDGKDGDREPSIFVEYGLEQMEASLVDSEEMEVKGMVVFRVLATSCETARCVGDARVSALDTAKYAALPGMVMCYAEKDTPLWDFGKKYYVPVEELKRQNNLTMDYLKAGNGLLVVKGAGRA